MSELLKRVRFDERSKLSIESRKSASPVFQKMVSATAESGTKGLTIPNPPNSGTHVLGSIGGVLTWIATEEC